MAKILCFLVFFCFSCREETKIPTIEMTPDSVNRKWAALNAQNDSLIKAVKALHTNYWFNPESVSVDFFADNNIVDPQIYIDSALRANPQLLPMKGVLGGTMQFDSIQLLSSKWLIADYSDGHIVGKSIYAYKFKRDGTIEFKIIASMKDE